MTVTARHDLLFEEDPWRGCRIVVRARNVARLNRADQKQRRQRRPCDLYHRLHNYLCLRRVLLYETFQ